MFLKLTCELKFSQLWHRGILVWCLPGGSFGHSVFMWGRLKEEKGPGGMKHAWSCLKLIPIWSGLSRRCQLQDMIQDRLPHVFWDKSAPWGAAFVTIPWRCSLMNFWNIYIYWINASKLQHIFYFATPDTKA